MWLNGVDSTDETLRKNTIPIEGSMSNHCQVLLNSAERMKNVVDHGPFLYEIEDNTSLTRIDICRQVYRIGRLSAWHHEVLQTRNAGSPELWQISHGSHEAMAERSRTIRLGQSGVNH